jgi:hypothetical protein
MSTKTSFKRIAAVAALALTLGGFSAVSAYAADGDITAATGFTFGGTATAATISTTSGAGNYVGLNLATTAGVVQNVVVTNGTVSGAAANTDLTSGNGTASLVITAGTGITSEALTIPTPTAGTVKASVYGYTAGVRNSTATSTLTITVSDAAVLVPGYVTSQITTGAVANGGAVALTVTSARYTGSDATVQAPATAGGAAGTEAAVIGVALASAYDTGFSAYLSATITGAGTISIKEDTTTIATSAAPAIASTGTQLTSAAKNKFYRVSVFADGRAGVGTITISSGTTALLTKTVTFYSTATKATATQNLFVAKAGRVLGAQTGTQNYAIALTGATVEGTVANQDGTAAYTVALVDANGNAAAPAQTPIIKSSSSSKITSNGCTAVTAKVGVYQCSVSGTGGAASGDSATVTFSIPATSTEVADATTGLYSITAAALKFVVGGSVQKVVLSSDATTYMPLTPMTLIATATDSKGFAAYDQDFTTGTPLIASLKTSAAFAGTATFSSPAYIINGVGKFGTLYAPSIEGGVTVTGVDNVSTAGEAVSATFTVDNGAISAGNALALDAANAATDAANNAYDEAQNATQAASDALAAVTALAAQVKSLTAMVLRIGIAVAKLKK